MNGRVMVVEITVVYGVERFGGAKAGWEQSEINGVIGFLSCIRLVVTADGVSAMVRRTQNKVGATLLVTELRDTAGGSLTVDLDTDHDEIARLKEALGDRAIGAGTVVFTAVKREVLEDFCGENGVILTKAKVVVDRG